MPVQKINIGAAPNDKTGDSLREAFALTNAAIDQVNANTAAIAGKVDKAAGMGLSQNSFTDEQRDKLNGLEGTHWRGTFLSVSALQAALPTANAGDYADVDTGEGADVQRFIWDVSDAMWLPSGGGTSLTAAQVKALYESNPDTNAFPDASMLKLAGVEAGARMGWSSVAITANADLNNYTTEGAFMAANVAVATSVANRPAAVVGAFGLHVIGTGGTLGGSPRVKQVLYRSQTADAPDTPTYTRWLDQGVWTAWIQEISATRVQTWVAKQTFSGGAAVPTLPISAFSTDAANTAFVQAMSTAGINGAYNVLINPNMEVSHRGTSFNIAAAATAAETHTLDRWRVSKLGTSTATVAQFAGNAAWRTNMCIQHTVVTATASLATNAYEMIEQPIEGICINDMIGRDVVFSALVYSSKIGKYTVRLHNPSANHYFLGEFEITVANVWQQVAVVIAGGLTNAVSWNINSVGVGVRLGVVLAAGATRRSSTIAAWTSGDAIATSNQVNFLDTAGAVFRMTDVQLYQGSRFIPINRRPLQVEYDLCYRYLPVIEPDSSLAYGSPVAVGQVYAPSAAIIPVPFRVPARVTPTGLLAYALSNYWITSSDFTVQTPTSMTLYTYRSNSVGTLLLQLGSSPLAVGFATTFLAKAKIFYQGCEL